MGRRVCSNCGTLFDGSQCPICALTQSLEENTSAVTEEHERTREAIAEQTERISFELEYAAAEARAATEEAVEEHKRTTAHAWQLQARARSERASSLHASGMHQDALRLALQCIEQDPGNLNGFLVAVSCLKALGKSALTEQYVEKQIRLLNTTDYCDSPLYFARVLGQLPDDDAPMRLFVNVAEQNIRHWRSDSRIATIVNSLVSAHRLEDGARLLKEFLANFPLSPEVLALTLHVVKKLLDAGQRDEVSRIAGLVACKAQSLLHLVYVVEINALLGQNAIESLITFLRSREPARREDIEGGVRLFKGLVEKGALSASTVSGVKQAILERFTEWKPHIESTLYGQIAANTRKQDFTSRGGTVGFVSFFLLLFVSLGFIQMLHVNDWPVGLIIFGSLGGAFLIGSLSGDAMRYRKMCAEMEIRLASAVSSQNRIFADLDLPQISALPVPSRSAKVKPYSIFVAGYLIFVAGLVALQLLSQAASSANQNSVFANQNSVFDDELTGSSIGDAHGVRWTHEIGDHGAVFSAADASRIEYPKKVYAEGTIELWIKVDSGYGYDNYALKSNLSTAMIFSTDPQGGDVTWPGTARLIVSKDGSITWSMATSKNNQTPAATIKATKTNFRFGEWHAIGVSYGGQGQFIKLDGKILASNFQQRQIMGAAGTQQAPMDLPTIGETASHFWPSHRYEGGFEGVVAWFRASPKQQDWYLANGIGD